MSDDQDSAPDYRQQQEPIDRQYSEEMNRPRKRKNILIAVILSSTVIAAYLSSSYWHNRLQEREDRAIRETVIQCAALLIINDESWERKLKELDEQRHTASYTKLSCTKP